MNILEPNQTVRFITSIYNNSELVRTGTIADGSCLLHGILHATSLKYRNGDIDKRKRIITEFRKTLADSVTRDQWLKLNGGCMARISFSIEYRRLIDQYYHEPNDIDKFVQNVISKDIVEKVFEKYVNEKDIYMINSKITSTLLAYMKNKLNDVKNNSKVDALLQKVEGTFNIMFQTAIEKALLNYKQVLEDDRVWLGEEHIELISGIFGITYIFLIVETDYHILLEKIINIHMKKI